MRLLTTITLSIISISVFAKQYRTYVAYDEDNRIETYKADFQLQELARSTAAMINSTKILDLGANVMIDPTTLNKAHNLCPGEKFASQPSAASCSGFLVGEDVLVTAGHCIQSKEDCAKYSWVFDYKLNASNNKADIAFTKDNVFKCKEVLGTRLETVKSEGAAPLQFDYAVIKLDRKVTDRTPLKFRKNNKISDDAEVFVIGHPSGLPQKVGLGGEVFKNQNDVFFEATLDTFGGNSGSAVFNAKTNEVEGILVRGAKDYKFFKHEKCYRVNEIASSGLSQADGAESVSRINQIPANLLESL